MKNITQIRQNSESIIKAFFREPKEILTELRSAKYINKEDVALKPVWVVNTHFQII